MEFKFDANQEFQTQAVEAVADLFEGQSLVAPDLTFALGGGFAAVGNRLDIGESTILSNLRNVQERRGIQVDEDPRNRVKSRQIRRVPLGRLYELADALDTYHGGHDTKVFDHCGPAHNEAHELIVPP